MTRPRRPEAIAQSRAVKLYRACGCTVLSTSQVRPSRVSVGLPDLIVLHPRGHHFWHEVKAPGGKVSKEQAALHKIAFESGIYVVVGDETAARRHLITLGLLWPTMEVSATVDGDSVTFTTKAP